MTLEHLKNNIEKQRYMGGNGRDDDPLNLDGSIELPSQFNNQHVRIRDGEVIEKSRRRLDDLSEGDLSSIPSYDHLDPQGRNGVPLINGMSKLDERTLAVYKENFKLTEKSVSYDEFVKLASRK